MGRSPRLIPLLVLSVGMVPPEEKHAHAVIEQLQLDVTEAQDNLLKAKVMQVAYANALQSEEPQLDIGDRVMLSTKNRQQQYTLKRHKCVAKFMPRFDGLFSIADIDPLTSTVTLDLPLTLWIHPKFHTLEVFFHKYNDNALFPSWGLTRPGPIVTEDGKKEHFIKKIVDSRRQGCRMQYLVHWVGYRVEEDKWLSGLELVDNRALDDWLVGNG